MFKSGQDSISFNPTAPPFLIRDSSKSRSSATSSSTSSSRACSTLRTSRSSSGSIDDKFPFRLPTKEFIPRSQLTSTASPELDFESPSQCTGSGGSAEGSSLPSDTTLDGSKDEDLLLSMKYPSLIIEL